VRSGPKKQPLARNDDEKALVEAFFTKGLSRRSVALYLTAIRKVQTWCATNDYSVATMPVHAVMDYAEELPYTWASRRRLRSALMHYWEATGRENPPLKAIRVPKQPRMISKALDEKPAAILLRAARARRDTKGLVVLLGLQLGLRRFEIASLRWSAFDSDHRWITIVGKGDVTETLPVHPDVRKALLAVRPKGTPGEWVFPGRDGHISPATAWTWTIQVAKEAGLGHIATHVLRHTCLTTANDQTKDLRAVQAFARHARPETTAGYTRVHRDRLVDVMNSLSYEEAAG
jgi:integrase